MIYDRIWVTPKTIIFKGVRHEPAPCSLVIKMSAGQSLGISCGWSKTVIVPPGMKDDWGDADVMALYTKMPGYTPAVGEKVFFEMYWTDTATGFTGVSVFDSQICETEEEAAEERYVKPDSHVSDCDVDFSTGAPVISFDAVCFGHSNVASSYAYLEEDMSAECLGTSRPSAATGRFSLKKMRTILTVCPGKSYY